MHDACLGKNTGQLMWDQYVLKLRGSKANFKVGFLCINAMKSTLLLRMSQLS
jgi:hypothetical protein